MTKECWGCSSSTFWCFSCLCLWVKDSFTKLNIFNMTEYGEILYIHPDVIALHDPQQIFDYKAIQESSSHFFAAPDWGDGCDVPADGNWE